MLLTTNSNSTNYLEIREPELLLHSYEKGEEISLIEPGFWQVYRGVVQLSRISSSGDEIILGWVTVNNSFGYCSQNNYHYQAKTLSNTYLRWCSPLKIAKSPELARILMAQLSQRLIKAEQLLTITGMRKVEERLWELLLFLKQEMGQSVVDGTRLTIRFTHQHLASIICTTRVTVTRLLGNFQARGLISIDSDRHIIVREN
ncbi:MAG: Crp/Fnr family transcriptional regulator [Xenococcaceae cyanobacterium MO_188.B32]|nr:Crp/Fnr family transcriptional regulator [Xenococcaceae cyanobacterium MO_188.B32]